MLSRKLASIVAVVAAAGWLAACSSAPAPTNKPRSKEYFSEAVYGKASPRVVQPGESAPRGGGRYMVGKPYRIAGKTYIPKDNPNYSATGLASWYGEAFHGRKTANGEVYDIAGLTAAHPTMPLPSYARVTNVANGRSMVVRVNDRGPFHRNRVIDVSKAVADLLGFRAAGTAKVKVDYVGPASMDGLDHNQLFASYSEGGPASFGGAAPIMVAAAPAPAPRLRPAAVTAYQPLGDPMVVTPAGLIGEDPLAPLIMRTSLASSYAPQPLQSPALAAIESFAGGDGPGVDLQTALEHAAARKAREIAAAGSVTVIQLGTFADPANASRVVHEFSRFGFASGIDDASQGRRLTVVRLKVGAGVAPDAVIAAAARAGLKAAVIAD